MDIVTLDIVSALINSLKYANLKKYLFLQKLVVLVNKLSLHINDEIVYTATTAALLKDIGTIGQTEEELKKNIYKSAEIIRVMPDIIPLQYEIADIILELNERLDGSGAYSKTDISYEAQLIGIVEDYLESLDLDKLKDKCKYNQEIVKGLEEVLSIDYIKTIFFAENDYLSNLFYQIIKKNNVYILEIKGVEEEQFLSTIASMIDTQHEYTAGHTKRVATYSYTLAKQMGYQGEQLSEIRYAAYLHDIGKLAVDINLLDKPEKLTLEEFEKVKEHALHSYNILQGSPQLKKISYGALHHERVDGKGYPFHLKGNEIPEQAKIIAIADILDALTSNRPYRKPVTFKEALKIMERSMVGTALDPKIFEIAKQIF